jgi:hypothetical protein
MSSLSKGIADRKMGLKGPSRTDDFNKHKKPRKNTINEMVVDHILEEYGKRLQHQWILQQGEVQKLCRRTRHAGMMKRERMLQAIGPRTDLKT